MSRSRRLMRDKHIKPDKIDYISIFYLLISLLMGVVLMTLYQNDQSSILISTVIVMIFGISGVCGRLFTSMNQGGLAPVQHDSDFDDDESLKVLIGLMGGIFGISVIQTIFVGVGGLASVSNTTYEAGLQLGFFCFVAINEELFFRFLVYPVLRDLFSGFIYIPNWLISAFLTSGIFMVIHLAVYGALLNLTLVYVYFSSVLLCLIYEYTKRVSVTISVHIIVNVLASNYLIFILSGGLLS